MPSRTPRRTSKSGRRKSRRSSGRDRRKSSPRGRRRRSRNVRYRAISDIGAMVGLGPNINQELREIHQQLNEHFKKLKKTVLISPAPENQKVALDALLKWVNDNKPYPKPIRRRVISSSDSVDTLLDNLWQQHTNPARIYVLNLQPYEVINKPLIQSIVSQVTRLNIERDNLDDLVIAINENYDLLNELDKNVQVFLRTPDSIDHSEWELQVNTALKNKNVNAKANNVNSEDGMAVYLERAVDDA